MMNNFQREHNIHENKAQQTFEIYNRAINELPPLKSKKTDQKHTRLLPMFLTFLAGALVVAGLAFTSDYYNLFSNSSTSVTSGKVSSYQGKLVQASHHSSSQSIAQTYETASKAVVKIENYSKLSSTSIFSDPRMWMFLSKEDQRQLEHEYNNEQENSNPTDLQLSGTGTGYIFEADGYILTNEHVIHGAEHISVTVPGYDEPFSATVVSENAEMDIAVLKIEPQQDQLFATIPLGDSDRLNVGEWVIAIGNPYGYDYTLTMGVISAKERPISIENSDGQLQQFKHMLQTDTSINPGNSGGPLLNEAGEVIGMNTAVNAEAQGIGFAIPINEIKDYLQSLPI